MRVKLEYMGGGWFRQTNPPAGQEPIMLHGEHALKPQWDSRHWVPNWAEIAERNRPGAKPHPSERETDEQKWIREAEEHMMEVAEACGHPLTEAQKAFKARKNQ